jgi:peroxiredoxin
MPSVAQAGARLQWPVMDAPRVGDAAPEFSLFVDARGTTVGLSSLRGSVVVLLVYVFDFSPG